MSMLPSRRRATARPRLVRRLTGATILAVATAVLFGLLSPGNAVAVPQAKSPEQITDTYVFGFSMADFLKARKERRHDAQLVWESDGCSIPPQLSADVRQKLQEFDFSKPCIRHDFGYRNYRQQGRMTDANRERIDNRFAVDMRREVCDKIGDAARKKRCVDLGVLYWLAVRAAGDRYV